LLMIRRTCGLVALSRDASQEIVIPTALAFH
jgi:hypothetical protein